VPERDANEVLLSLRATKERKPRQKTKRVILEVPLTERGKKRRIFKQSEDLQGCREWGKNSKKEDERGKHGWLPK